MFKKVYTILVATILIISSSLGMSFASNNTSTPPEIGTFANVPHPPGDGRCNTTSLRHHIKEEYKC